MFDKRNMTITRRAAASSGPCLADRVWLTLWPASSHAQPGLACTGQCSTLAAVTRLGPNQGRGLTRWSISPGPGSLLARLHSSKPLSSTRSLHCLACKDKLKKYFHIAKNATIHKPQHEK